MPTGKGPLRIAIEDFIDTFGIGKRVHASVVEFIEMLEQEGYKVYENFVAQFGISRYLPPMLQPANVKAASKVAPVQLAGILLMLAGVIIGVFAGAMQPIAKLVMYNVDHLANSFRPDPMALVEARRREKGLSSTVKDYLSDLGIDDISDRLLTLVSDPLLDPNVLVILQRRAIITDDMFFDLMDKHGYSRQQADYIKQTAKPIPGPSDLVRFADRFSWDDQIASKFRYDELFPPEFLKLMQAQGFDNDMSKLFWRSHWQLPGLEQVFEMFHRLRPGQSENVFGDDELDAFLKTTPLPIYFHNRLKDIAYQPLTRVDIRRMFGANVLNADEVFQAYLDLGYNKQNSQRMTDFTTHVEKAEEKGLTRAAIQDAYRRGVWHRDQAKAALIDIKFSDQDAEFWLDLVDVEQQNKMIDDKLAVIEAKYIADLLNDQTVYTELGPLNLPSDRIATLLGLWNVRKYNRINLPSRTELDDFLRRGIITDDIYRSYLHKDGYAADVIGYFVQRIAAIVSQDTQDAAAAAQAEQDRIAKSKLATQYQKDVTNLNVALANIDVNIADIRVAMFDATNPEDIKTMKQNIAVLLENKKQIELQKAQLKQTLVSSAS